MSFTRLILTASAPPIGGLFYSISPDRVFIYIGVLFAIAIGILIITPIPKLHVPYLRDSKWQLC